MKQLNPVTQMLIRQMTISADAPKAIADARDLIKSISSSTEDTVVLKMTSLQALALESIFHIGRDVMNKCLAELILEHVGKENSDAQADND